MLCFLVLVVCLSSFVRVFNFVFGLLWAQQQNRTKNTPPLPKEHNNDNKHEQQKKCQLGFEAVRLFLKHATMHVNVTRFDVFLPRRQDGV